MTVEITTDIQVQSLNRAPDNNRKFHFCCFGNFSGSSKERSSFDLLSVGRNTWADLFSKLKPSISMQVELNKVDDLPIYLSFERLSDFNEKSLVKKVPMAASLKSLEERIEKASKDSPLNISRAFSELDDPRLLGRLTQMAGDSSENQTIDLLDMVDIGEEDEDGSFLPEVAKFLAFSEYKGQNRSKLISELIRLRRNITDQIQINPGFLDLHANWRALKFFLPLQNVKISLIDCRKQDWCDATFSCFVKPEKEPPLPLDLAFYCEDISFRENDCHILHHLGRMADFLLCPLVLNASKELFDCKSWNHLTHLRDISGRMSRPELIKWRKFRNEPGSGWLFLAVNPFRLDYGEGDDAPGQLAAHPAYYLALLVAESVEQNKWLGELLHPGHQLPIATRCLAKLDGEQGYDLSFEGFCGITGKDQGDRLYLLGMLAAAHITIPMGETLQTAALVEFSLSYRFYIGCLSRFLEAHAQEKDLEEKLFEYAGLKDLANLQIEEDDGKMIFRLKPPFKIFGEQPDVILAI